jgi:hypothetical protein
LGTTPVSCTATDAHSNTGTGTFTVTVSDHTAPVLTLPPSIAADATVATMTQKSAEIIAKTAPITP